MLKFHPAKPTLTLATLPRPFVVGSNLLQFPPSKNTFDCIIHFPNFPKTLYITTFTFSIRFHLTPTLPKLATAGFL